MLDDSVRGDRPALSEGAGEALAQRADVVGRIDLLTAGYPCQPHSTAARGRNRPELDLWPEALRIIRVVRPRWVILENVPGYGLEHVERSCRALEDSAYAVWPIDTAIEIRKHVRRRLWVVAHAHGQGEPQRAEHGEMAGLFEVAARWWCEPEPLGMADGLPIRMDRMKMLGNAIEPAVAELLIRAVLQSSGQARIK
jgi:DNA (cytosine-5)-methyltransferase 1